MYPSTLGFRVIKKKKRILGRVRNGLRRSGKGGRGVEKWEAEREREG